MSRQNKNARKAAIKRSFKGGGPAKTQRVHGKKNTWYNKTLAQRKPLVPNTEDDNG
jgi:hypothetical protein